MRIFSDNVSNKDFTNIFKITRWIVQNLNFILYIFTPTIVTNVIYK